MNAEGDSRTITELVRA